ncbi:MAG: glutathione gamma-glutamylcysteinyltransferase, partial [Gammaproteobacteria bacterium]|nr:glutathione gamma-glutamylcysteinyltransferase [Gammaproteobacteria bacterium]
SQSDRFLLMDVARFKYPPVWVKTVNLWNSMKTLDKDAGKMRGFVIIQKSL